jgi:hypothetical protein
MVTDPDPCVRTTRFSDEPPLTQVLTDGPWIFPKNLFIDFHKVCPGCEQRQVVNYENQKIFKKIKFSFPEEDDRNDMGRHYENTDRSEKCTLG